MTVYLVGAGPGDPMLITVRGADLLRRADVVVHDRLVDERLLSLAPATARRVDVGKRPGDSAAQERINGLLVELAGRHDVVVRLKGGDPYVFGRGGEEALALERAGLEYEVVPGVSSVNGVLAYAGIPVTHRGLADSFTVVTGHGAGAGAISGVDWDAMARVGGTIVVLMGVAHRAEMAERLIAGGRSPATPVAVIEHGTVRDQRTVRTTLGALFATETATPAIIVVGDVAELDLAWFERRPLFGWRVVVTRTQTQASILADQLAQRGAWPVELPVIEIAEPGDGGAALDVAAAELADYDWVVFTSANAVDALWHKVRDARALGRARVAAIGDGTASALAARGIVADLVPDRLVAESLLEAFPAPDALGARVLLPRAAVARDVLPDGLRERGYVVDVVEAYRTLRPELGPDALDALAGAHAVTFTSSSTVTGFLELAGRSSVPPVVACIGPVTAATARAEGLLVDVESPTHTVSGLVEALAGFARDQAGPPSTRK